jgi:hypothetical protein
MITRALIAKSAFYFIYFSDLCFETDHCYVYKPLFCDSTGTRVEKSRHLNEKSTREGGYCKYP